MGRKRDKNGRFIKGDSGGPGRPPLDREVEYWEIAKTACSFDDWRAVVAQAVQDAKAGDTAARAWLTSIVVGSPGKLRARALDGSKPAPVGSAGDVVSVLAQELASVGQFPNDVRRAALVARLSDSLIRAIETSDMSETLERIERMLKGETT